MARGIAGPAQAESKKEEKIEVMNAGPVREIDMSPPGHTLDPNLGAEVDRASIDPNTAAPIVRSAVDAPPIQMGHGGGTGPALKGTPAEEVPTVRVFRVERDATITDKVSGARTKLREGKEISQKHYDIRDLQRQGVRLKDITGLDPNAPI